MVSEVKFKSLSPQDRIGLKKQISAKWEKTRLSRQLPAYTIEILDISTLTDG